MRTATQTESVTRTSRSRGPDQFARLQDCDDKFDPQSGFANGNVKWCPEASPEQLEARCNDENQCIIRDAKNGKLIRKNKNSDNGACDAALYDCASSE